jgi:dTMP kinase
MFITFEGIDGSGKSTQMRRLATWLQEQGQVVETMRDPGGTPVAEQVRTLLLDPAASLDNRTELFLFAAARAQLVAKRIRPALQAGRVVLCDRFYDSTTAYQGGGRNTVPRAWIQSLHEQTTGGLVPTRTYLIDVPVEEAARRRRGESDDRMEQEAWAFHERVRTTYRSLAEEEPTRVCCIDGTQSPTQVQTAIRTDLKTIWTSVRAGTPS